MFSRKRAVLAWMIAAAATALWVIGCGATGNPVPSDNTAALAGQAKFNNTCAGCHNAGSLRQNASRITNDMGTISGAMNGISLTDEEVANLQAYLATQ